MNKLTAGAACANEAKVVKVAAIVENLNCIFDEKLIEGKE